MFAVRKAARHLSSLGKQDLSRRLLLFASKEEVLYLVHKLYETVHSFEHAVLTKTITPELESNLYPSIEAITRKIPHELPQGPIILKLKGLFSQFLYEVRQLLSLLKTEHGHTSYRTRKLFAVLKERVAKAQELIESDQGTATTNQGPTR